MLPSFSAYPILLNFPFLPPLAKKFNLFLSLSFNFCQMRKVWIFMMFFMWDLCCSINDEGRGLLKIKEKVELDPYDSLLNWSIDVVDPCSWFEVECFSGGVASLKKSESITARRLLQVGGEDKVMINLVKKHKNKHKKSSLAAAISPSLSPIGSIAPSPHIEFLTPVPAPSSPVASPSPSPVASPSPSPVESPELNTLPPSMDKISPVRQEHQKRSTNTWRIYVPIAAGASFLFAFSIIYFLCCRGSRVVTVRPWATGLSGQLQKAFVTGVPSLKRSELQTACEDFSNIIGSLSDCKLYKGTLSSGVEIAVISTLVTSSKDWSKQSESHFWKKISVLSKVNHKNFMNLLGYCAEQEPFTRMMVFEYAPNGTLHEHLHVKEAEELDWGARLRVAMGIAYCLDHMHHLDPPVYLEHLNSSTIYLTDDYASKVGDVIFSKDPIEVHSDSKPPSQPIIVHKFGMLLLELLSGRVPFLLEECKSLSIEELIDPNLKEFQGEDARALFQVIRACLNPDLNVRPTISQVVAKLKEITSMSADIVTPKVSPLWWAEIEILSS